MAPRQYSSSSLTVWGRTPICVIGPLLCLPDRQDFNSLLCNSRNATRCISSCIPSVKTSNTEDICIRGPFLHLPSERQHLNEQHWRLDVSHCGGWNLLQMTGYKLSPCNCIPQKHFTTQNIPALFSIYPVLVLCVLCRTRMGSSVNAEQKITTKTFYLY